MIEGNHHQLGKRRQDKERISKFCWLVDRKFFQILWCLLIFVYMRGYMERVMLEGLVEKSICDDWAGNRRGQRESLNTSHLKLGLVQNFYAKATL